MLENSKKIQMRDAVINALYSKAKKDKNIIFISNEQGAIALDKFRSDLPDQFINAGISEQNLISMASGLANTGKKVFVYSIASFISLRCLEQIKLDLCVMKSPVKILAVGTGYSYSQDGPSHHSTEDLAIISSLPNIEFYSPSNSVFAEKLVPKLLKSKNPAYIRLDRDVLIYPDNKFKFNNDFVVHNAKKNNDLCTIISTGVMTSKALSLIKKFNKSIKIIDMIKLKPFNEKKVLNEIKHSKKIVVIEEHVSNGGLSGVIAQLIMQLKQKIKFKKICLNEKNTFIYGSREIIHKKNNMDEKDIIKIINSI